MKPEVSDSEKLTAAQRIVNTIAKRVESGVVSGAKLLTYGVVVATIVQIISPVVGTIVVPPALTGIVNIFVGTTGAAVLSRLVDKVGGDMLTGLIVRVAGRKEASNDDIFKLLEEVVSDEAIHQSLTNALNDVDILTANRFHEEMVELKRSDRRYSHLILRQQTQIENKLDKSISQQDKILENTTEIRGILSQPKQYVSFGYANHIQSFIDEYAGTETSPVPFGGRSTELSELNHWVLADSSPQRLLMIANAGRGKSALLVQWVKWLRNNTDLLVVFVPISIRFDTALKSVAFAALAHQLAAIYGERISSPNYSGDEWHEMCLSYLRREPPEQKKLLVIVDGLDEAADWEASATTFPSQIASSVKVLVSARILGSDLGASGWLKRLNWEKRVNTHIMELPKLTKAGIKDVLVSMGDPLAQIVSNIDVLEELNRLTEGDPLLIRLYVEMLQPGIDTEFVLGIEDLLDIEPGISGYIARWWNEQEKQWQLLGLDPLAKTEMVTFLNLCAAAMGPLMYDDLSQLAPEHFSHAIQITRIAGLAKRIFVGDGKTQGFVFSHSRFNQYFWEEMSKNEQAQWDERFVSYGNKMVDQVRSKTLAETKVPQYVIQFFGAHLMRRGSTLDELLILTSNEWYQATTVTTGTHSVFLNDIQRVWTFAANNYNPETDSIDTQTIGQQVRCALITSSLRSLAANIPTDLICQLVEAGIWTATQAVIHIQQKPNAEDRVKAIAAISPQLDLSFREQVLETALGDITLINDSWRRGQTLAEITPHLPEQLLPEAHQHLNKIGYFDRFSATKALAIRYAIVGNSSEAIWLIGTYDRDTRVSALDKLMPYVDDANRQIIQEGLPHLRRFARSKQTRIDSLIKSLDYQPVDICREIAQECLKIATGSPFRPSLLSLWPYLTLSQREYVISELIKTAKAEKQPQTQKEILDQLIPYLEFAPNTFPYEILGIVKQNNSPFDSQNEQIPDVYVHGQLLARLVSLGFEADAIEMALNEQNLFAKISLLQAIIPCVSLENQRELLDQALTMLTHVVHRSEFCKNILVETAPHFSSVDFKQAVAIVSKFDYERIRAETLTHLAKFATDSMQIELLHSALISSEAINDGVWQVYPLIEAGKALDDADSKNFAFLSALTRAQKVTRPDMRIRSLGFVAPHLDEPLKHQAFQDCLDTARHHMKAANVSHQFERIVTDIPSDFLREAFRVAEVSQSNLRWHMMTAIASRMDADFQERVGELSLRHIVTYGDHLCGQFIWSMAHLLPPVARNAALEIARKLPLEPDQIDGSWRINAMTALAYQYPDEQRDQIIHELLDMVRNELGDDMWLITLSQHINIITQMESAEFRQIVLNATYAIQDVAARLLVMVRIARFYEPELEKTLYREALNLCNQIDHFHGRSVFVELSYMLPIEMHDDLLKLTDKYVNYSDDKIIILLNIAFRTNDKIRPQLFRQVASLIVDKQRHHWSQEYAWLNWVTLSEKLSIKDVHVSWQSTLSKIGNQMRLDLLFDIWHLVPMIERLGGKTAIDDTARAIVEVSTRWQ